MAAPLSQREFAILESACARHEPVELFRTGEQPVCAVARGRLLAVDDRQVYVGQARTIGRAGPLQAGEAVTAFFAHEGAHQMFQTSVVKARCVLRLDEAQRVLGIVLVIPPRVRPGQRRAHYRVLLAGSEPIVVSLHRALPLGDGGLSPEPTGLHGWLVDASGGGLSVRLWSRPPQRPALYDRYFARFILPEEGPEICVLCELRQIRPILDGAALRLGLMMLPWPTAAHLNRQVQPLMRFLAAVERRQIRSA